MGIQRKHICMFESCIIAITPNCQDQAPPLSLNSKQTEIGDKYINKIIVLRSLGSQPKNILQYSESLGQEQLVISWKDKQQQSKGHLVEHTKEAVLNGNLKELYS